MKNCDSYKELISQQLDGEINEDQAIELAEHLASCPECRQFKQSMVALHEDLLKLPEIELTESIVDQLLADKRIVISEKKSIFRKKNWKPYYGFAAAALILIMLIPLLPLMNQQKADFSADSAENFAMVTEEAEDSNQRLFTASAPELDTDIPSGGTENLEKSTQIVGTVDYGLPVDVTIAEDSSEKLPAAQQAAIYTINTNEEGNQLIIYKENVEDFRTAKWTKELSLHIESIDGQYVTYALYNADNTLNAKYQINLLEKQEIKIN